jgi:hypothetical protein
MYDDVTEDAHNVVGNSLVLPPCDRSRLKYLVGLVKVSLRTSVNIAMMVPRRYGYIERLLSRRGTVVRVSAGN